MNERNNVHIVTEAYAAFGRGDLPAVLDAIAPDVDWHIPGPAEAPEPREFVAQGDHVLVLGHYEGRVRVTGKSFAADWVMAWRMRDGRAVAFREYTDTESIAAAFR